MCTVRLFGLFVLLGMLLCMTGSSSSSAADPELAKIIRKVTGTFEPAEAKPGQTVTFKLKVELDPSWYTYPTVQPDKGARSQTNKITFPTTGPAIFVGTLKEPENPKSKEESVLGIDELLYYPGGGTWERTLVVSPNAKAGETEIKVDLRIQICDKDNCFPPQKIEVKSKLKISDGPAVAVEEKYKTEVQNALKKSK